MYGGERRIEMKAGLLWYGKAGGYALCKRCKRWQKQQSGNRLVFQDALGQQSGWLFGAIGVKSVGCNNNG